MTTGVGVGRRGPTWRGGGLEGGESAEAMLSHV